MHSWFCRGSDKQYERLLDRHIVNALEDVRLQGVKILTKLSDYATRVETHLETINVGLTDISSDIQVLKDLITQLQTSPGPISVEDQAALDAAEAKVSSLATRVTDLAAENPPVTPTP